MDELAINVAGEWVAVGVWLDDFFSDEANGKIDSISKQGCLALAQHGSMVWNHWRRLHPAKPCGHFHYENAADFSGIDFRRLKNACGGDLTFADFEFGDGVNFSNTQFRRHWEFDRAVFGERADFSGAFIGARSSFKAARFERFTKFENVTFEDWIDFDFAECGLDVSFAGSTFGASVRFNGVSFGPDITFDRCTFASGCCFETLRPERPESIGWAPYEPIHDSFNAISFKACTFQGEAIFKNRVFRDKACFDDSSFATPPDFSGCTLHQYVTFDGVEFPAPSGEQGAIRRYRTLKLAFNDLQAGHEEQRFFSLEMAEIAAAQKGHKKWLFDVYAKLSDYGMSIVRPATWYAISFCVFALLYGLMSWVTYCFPEGSECIASSKWIEFSLLQAIPLPGLDKMVEAVWPVDVKARGVVSGLMTVLIITQKLVSLLLLFFIGLALRNLFRFK
ncbi:hypothetical protein SAMN05216487_3725 [Pseudomonas sp. UC 17F4]|uniref:pentapeptide repeat-containing protein n=1 Tax=Pseudomonas sp. UC 17F4 TaxID=1855328 RepID=UPI00088DB981|nr:pentapeptide repeat-containing protein [Pseudomonas sp. UC 17F4]SDQ75917.1 hypothetical protein SAMN05216487_3725 [Pseudomonas sp. UC 17F4]